MQRSRRVDIFLLLYLTAVVGFVVVSRGRDTRDRAVADRIDRIVTDFIPPLPLSLEADTFVHYVDAEADTLVPHDAVFLTRVLARDIGLEDGLLMNVHTVSRNGMLQSPSCVSLGQRRGVGGFGEDMVAIPVRAHFPLTGLWEVTLLGTATRLHLHNGKLEYRGRLVDTGIVPRQMLQRLETRLALLRVRVVDTSHGAPRAGDPVSLRPERSEISSAAGFEVRNRITVGPPWLEPAVRIASGGGEVRLVSHSGKGDVWEWRGEMPSHDAEVVLEAQTHLGKQGKDIARTVFRLHGVTPDLLQASDRLLYAGEELLFDLRVAGLTDSTRYSWKLFEVTGKNASLKKEGHGPRVRYLLPNSFTGKTLRLEAVYSGAAYPYVDAATHTAGMSTFTFDVTRPPLHIVFDPPASATSSQTFSFSASRYADPANAGKQHLWSLDKVSVQVLRENGTELAARKAITTSGRIEINLPETVQYRAEGERMIFRIQVDDVLVTRTIIIRSDARRR